MRFRVALAWLVVLSLVVGLVGVLGSHRPAQRAEAGERFEVHRETVRVEGHVGPRHRTWRQAFDVPADATVDTHVRWFNDRARLRHGVRRADDRLAPEASASGRFTLTRRFELKEDRYLFTVADRTRHVGTRFVGHARITWRTEITTPPPSPSPEPTTSPEPTATPTPSPEPSPSPDPSPAPDPSPTPDPGPAPGAGVHVFSVGTPANRVDEALAMPTVHGISLRIGWAGIEPSPGDYRWAKIDETIAQARAAGKVAMIRVIAGIFSPDWVTAQVETIRFSDRFLYNPANYPDQVTMPVPWDGRYLALWDRFIAAFGARYDGAAGLYSVQMSGGGFIGEMTLPTDVGAWLDAGYTDARLIGAWRDIIGSYRRAFPRTPFNLDITEPFGSLLATNVVRPVVTGATSDGGKRAWIQSNALRAAALGFIGPYRQVIRDVNGITTVGYQMIGDAPTAASLHDAFTVALQDGADYVEVYGTDVLDAVNRDELRYLADGG
ncbi:MAG TPA: hypothetical protein VE032_03780 [Actinomycetota bacterium]|nr:hypothetical protein [Actinomycetota bacterium]